VEAKPVYLPIVFEMIANFLSISADEMAKRKLEIDLDVRPMALTRVT
jgi:hypothetical protein